MSEKKTYPEAYTSALLKLINIAHITFSPPLFSKHQPWIGFSSQTVMLPEIQKFFFIFLTNILILWSHFELIQSFQWMLSPPPNLLYTVNSPVYTIKSSFSPVLFSLCNSINKDVQHPRHCCNKCGTAQWWKLTDIVLDDFEASQNILWKKSISVASEIFRALMAIHFWNATCRTTKI